MVTSTATITKEETPVLKIDVHSTKAFAPNAASTNNVSSDIHFRKGEDRIDDNGLLKVSEKEYEDAKYPEWLPTWDPNEKYEPYPADLNVKFSDKGHLASKDFKDLFPPSKAGSFKIKKLSPKLGSEVRGVQLSELSDAGKNDLALLVAQRGVVVFRDQDLKDKGLEFNKKFGEYFGPLHTHPSSGAPENYSQFHIVYRRKDPEEYNKTFGKQLSVRGWHSDVTYEKFTPGTTFFTILDGPETGGDTIFTDTVEAYNRLSPKFKEMISGLKAIHTSVRQAASSRANGGIERRPPSTNIHPLVRIHPVTKQKSLFTPNFIEEIDGLKKEESDAILKLLFDHVNHSHDLQVRASYEPGTVVVWDNRRVLHAGTFDWDSGEVRHCYRITPQAERPVENEDELEEWNK
ncbi:CYFA0S06e04500g1_1 [Cyberlindnera fabianii]|uniref:Alpha-ketoglutarate-dependent sulfonate dioxygenase n=1 Tax=Cyberlindnera fabianii TaxID=36022 RepID=A0A061B2I9_CYBFA|nr:Alpha-ketoglutarate-dependent sulfonate dioxygenase [Cyberlindnera fabianii]CDR41233.1 CYFA0S06e04500g1_1 [Cyberlindnera fabianii]